MRDVLSELGHSEAPSICGEVIHENNKLELSLPFGVYGFSVTLNDEIQVDDLFNEANNKECSNLEQIDDWKPVCGNQYPLYWGKDRRFGQRIHAHLAGCGKYKKTGIIRLGMYESLRDKEIHCGIVIVNDVTIANDFENKLKIKHPNLLKTKIIN